MRKKKASKKTGTKTTPVAAAKAAPDEKVAVAESESTLAVETPATAVEPSLSVEATLTAESATVEKPVAAVEPEPAEPIPAADKSALVAVETATEEKKPGKKRSVRKPKDQAAEPARKSGIGRKTKTEGSATASVKKSRTEKKAEQAPEEKKPLLSRRSKVDIPSELGVFVQFQGEEVNIATITERAKTDFKATNKRVKIVSLKLYVKPEEHAAYYVANDSYNGKITF